MMKLKRTWNIGSRVKFNTKQCNTTQISIA